MKRIGNLSKRRLPQTAAVFGLVLGLVWFVISNPTQPNRDPAPDSLIAHELASSNSEPAVSLPGSSRIMSTDQSPRRWKNGRRVNSLSDTREESAQATEMLDYYGARRSQGSRSSTETAALYDSKGQPIRSRSEQGDVEVANPDDSMSGEPDADDPLEDLQRNSHLSGRVLDQNGVGIPGVGLIATVQGLNSETLGVPIPADYLQYRTISDVDGRYFFNQIIDGDYRVSAVSNGQYAHAQLRVRSGTDFANLVLARERKILVQGRVSSTAGEPLWSAQITPLVAGVAGAYSDGRGQYQLTAAIADSRGGLGVKATLDGYREQMVLLNETDLSGDTLNLNFTLEPVKSVAMVSGTVVSADDGRPLVGVALELRSTSLRQLYRSVTGQAGEFLLSGVETGNDYSLLVSGGERHENFTRDQVEVSTSSLSLNIAMTPVQQGSLYAQVANLGGQAVPGFTLNVRRPSPPYNLQQVTSDGGGRFALHGLAAGAVVFERQSYPQITISGIELADNVDEHVQLVLDWGTDELTGVVIDGSGNPVGGSTILLTWSHNANGVQSWSTRKTNSDAQGGFAFRDLGPGTHTLVVEARGFDTTRLAHNVTADGYDVVVKLEPISIDTGSGS